jgi:hypothetical protein
MSLTKITELLQTLDDTVSKMKAKELQAALKPHSKAMLKVVFDQCKHKHAAKVDVMNKPRAKTSGLSLADAAVRQQ